MIVSERLLISGVGRKIVRTLRRAGTPTTRVSPEVFRSISTAERASGVGLIVGKPNERLSRFTPSSGEFWLLLESLRSLGNLGTLLRTSVAAGGQGLILIGGDIDPFDPAVVRASMGMLFRQRIVRTNLTECRHWVDARGVAVVGASASATHAYFGHRFSGPTLIALGHERRGLSDGVRRMCNQLVCIPMAQGIDSLNVSVAGSLLMYEIVRRCSSNSVGYDIAFSQNQGDD